MFTQLYIHNELFSQLCCAYRLIYLSIHSTDVDNSSVLHKSSNKSVNYSDHNNNLDQIVDDFRNDEEQKLQVMNSELNIKSLPNQMTSEDTRQHDINRKIRATANTSTGTYLCLYQNKFLAVYIHQQLKKLTK